VAELADDTRPQRRRLLIFALLGAVLGTAISLLFVMTAPAVFEATAFADVRRVAPDASSSIYATIDAISADANSAETFQSVIADVELSETVSELRSMVVIKPLFGNPSIRVTATAGSAQRASDIARGFVDAMEEMPVPQIVSDGPDYRLSLRQASTLPTRPTSPKPSHDLATGAFVGMALGLVVGTLTRPANKPRRKEVARAQ
jgi:capsular polysaccharide biosynthesis protein